MARSTDRPPAISAGEYAARRRSVFDALGNGAVVLSSGSEPHDLRARFRPDSDFYYLTGFREPAAVLVLRGGPNPASALFVRPRDPAREAWDGPRAGPEGAKTASGVDDAWPAEELASRLPDLLDGAERIVHAPWRDGSLDRSVRRALDALAAGEPKGRRAPDTLTHPRAVLHPLRLVKSDPEIALVEHAAAISAEAHVAAMRRCRPGVREAGLQAAIESVFLERGGTGPGYGTIVAAGANACVLHYRANAGTIGTEDLVLVDAGVEFDGYVADISRSFPAAGAMSGAVRAMYDVVREAEDAAIAAARPGATIEDVHDAAVACLARGLVDLSIVDGPPDRVVESGAYRRWYMHRTSHWLGLDVHDVGRYRDGGRPRVLEPGMVLTVEPGLYVRPDDDAAPAALLGRGIRIEDDVVVTPDGPRVLTRGVPVDPEEMTALLGTDA